ncbi:hypothetical protein [Micromonospora sp. NPDC023814]|uniref:hypothetical protein n=1 Tax=Micromonospora sp. NPDC023814 TaxID=3154596 RepID=UPI0033D1FC74
MTKELDRPTEHWSSFMHGRDIRGHRRVRTKRSRLPPVAGVLAVLTLAIAGANAISPGPSRVSGPQSLPSATAVPVEPVTDLPPDPTQASFAPSAAAGPAARSATPATRVPSPAKPTPSRLAEPGPVGKSPTPQASTTTGQPVPFVPQRIEAEASTTQISGGAAVVRCGSCMGGARVGYIGATEQVIVVANLPSSGLRTIRVTYETDGLRQLKIKANNVDVDARWLNGGGWEVPNSFEFTTTLPAGPLRLMFYNDVTSAPDVDQVVIS